MKPVAPPLLEDDTLTNVPSIQSEIRELCDRRDAIVEGDEGEGHERITIPAPPSAEVLRLATPLPPPDHAHGPDTIPAPPPSSARRPVQQDDGEENVPSTIPAPPRLRCIASCPGAAGSAALQVLERLRLARAVAAALPRPYDGER